MPEWLVTVCAGRWQLAGITAAQSLGARVMAIDGDRSAPGLELADEGRVADVTDPAAVVAAVRAAGHDVAGAVCVVAEAGQRAAAAVRADLGLSGARPPVVERLTDKAAQRAAWDAAGLPCPRWRTARTVDDVVAAAAAIGDDVIVKPVDGAGSRGVTRVPAGGDPSGAAAHALEVSRSGRAIVESFFVGTEFTVETFGRDGRHEVLAVTSKRKVPGSDETVALELATPDLPAAELDAVGRLATDALVALDYADGPGHTEILRDAHGRMVLVESAGRGGGFMVAEGLVPMASGFDLMAETVRAALGMAPGAAPNRRKAVVLRFFPSASGVVRSIEGFDRAAALDDVMAGPFVSVGETVGDARSDGDRLGYVLAAGATPTEARALADRASSLISFEIGPPR